MTEVSDPSDPGSAERPPREKAGPGITLLSVWAWFAFGVCVIVWLPLMLVTFVVTVPFDRGRYAVGYLYRKMPVVHEKLNPLWKVRVTGDVPSDPRHPYVVVSNHESFVDILAICHLPFEMKWLSKKEMFNIPFAGWLMYLAGDIKLYRGDRGSGQQAMERCKVWLGRKVSVIIFPEGTRSHSGELAQFKDGAFRLAIETQLPILPLVVNGTREALRKHDWRMGRSNAEVHVLAPVPTEGLTLDDVATLRERVRDAIAAQRDEMKTAAAGVA
jgi:1-acyl-sn-glycerol-3-phosphate acyltransferase